MNQSFVKAWSYFAGLTEKKNLAVLAIQYAWRRSRERRRLKRKQRRKVVVYGSSLGGDTRQTAHLERSKLLLDNLRVNYEFVDFNVDKMRRAEIEAYKGDLPIILINGHYIGGFDELQFLIDSQLFEDILDEAYLYKCVSCHMGRSDPTNETCGYCWKKYLFFARR